MNRWILATAGAAVSLVGTVAGVGAAQADAAVPHCGNADLKASYQYDDAGMSHVYGWIVLRNVSGHTCVTGGFGGISYVGHGNGTQIGAAADRDGSWRSYTLKPGHRLRSAIDEISAQPYDRSQCHPVHVDGFRVYVPNATKSQYVVHPTTGCARTSVHLLSHRAYRPA